METTERVVLGTGFVAKMRTRELVCDWIEPAEGHDLFTVTVRSNLTFDEIDAIAYGNGAMHIDLWKSIAPYVLAWNATAINLETGQVEPIPPPVEAGPQVFSAIDPVVVEWLGFRLKRIYQGDADRPKGLPPSTATPPTSNEADSGSPTRSPRTSRSSQTSTT
jgi:hypothetical protein